MFILQGRKLNSKKIYQTNEKQEDKKLSQKEKKNNQKTLPSKQDNQNLASFYSNHTFASIEASQFNNRQTQKFSQTLKKLTENKNLSEQFTISQIQNQWESIVGKENAKHTKPIFFNTHKKTLYIGITNQIMLFDFQRDRVLKKELLQKIQKEFPNIKHIHFQTNYQT